MIERTFSTCSALLPCHPLESSLHYCSFEKKSFFLLPRRILASVLLPRTMVVHSNSANCTFITLFSSLFLSFYLRVILNFDLIE